MKHVGSGNCQNLKSVYTSKKILIFGEFGGGGGEGGGVSV